MSPKVKVILSTALLLFILAGLLFETGDVVGASFIGSVWRGVLAFTAGCLTGKFWTDSVFEYKKEKNRK